MPSESLFSCPAIPKTVGFPLLHPARRNPTPRRLTPNAEDHPPRRLRLLHELPQGFNGQVIGCNLSPPAGQRHASGIPTAPFNAKIAQSLWWAGRDLGCVYEGVGFGRAGRTQNRLIYGALEPRPVMTSKPRRAAPIRRRELTTAQ